MWKATKSFKHISEILPWLSTDTALLSGRAEQENDHTKSLGNMTADVHCHVKFRYPKIISLPEKLIFSLAGGSGAQTRGYTLFPATFST